MLEYNFIEYSCTIVNVTEHSWTLADKVVHEVAVITNTEPLKLPPLYEAIDPDALETTVRAIDDGKIAFQYAECCITVESDCSISVEDEYECCEI